MFPIAFQLDENNDGGISNTVTTKKFLQNVHAFIYSIQWNVEVVPSAAVAADSQFQTYIFVPGVQTVRTNRNNAGVITESTATENYSLMRCENVLVTGATAGIRTAGCETFQYPYYFGPSNGFSVQMSKQVGASAFYYRLNATVKGIGTTDFDEYLRFERNEFSAGPV